MIGEEARRAEGPYALLVYRLRGYQSGHTTRNLKFHGRAMEPTAVYNAYIADAVRSGLTGEQIRCAFADAGAVIPDGVMSLGRLLTLDLTQQRDSWIRYWCYVVPRVLVAGARGELDGADLDGRIYTEHEVREVLPLCVTAQVEDLQLWSRLVHWALDELYPEYSRRTGEEHACQQRAVASTYLYPSEW